MTVPRKIIPDSAPKEEKKETKEEVHSRELNLHLKGIESTVTTAKTVGDGGASWRAKALQRQKENAELQDENKKYDRLDSLEYLSRQGSTEPKKQRQQNDSRSYETRDYLKKDSKISMQVPAMSNLSWRKQKEKEVEKDTSEVPITSNESIDTKISTSVEIDNKPVEILEDLNHLCAKALRAQLLGHETAYHEAISKIENKTKRN